MKRKNESDEKELVSKKAKQSDPENHDEGLGEDHDLERFRLANLPGADVLYIPDLVDQDEADSWFAELLKLETWYHPKLKVYGREVTQSRSIAAYATDPSITVRYSGHTVDLHYVYPPLLRRIQDAVERRLQLTFNYVMLNWYEDGNEYIGKHRDTKENKVIASLSLGAERTFIFTPNAKALCAEDGAGEVTKMRLANGSLLVMRGDTQKNWKHEIPKEPKVKEGRISLTFRQLESPSN